MPQKLKGSKWVIPINKLDNLEEMEKNPRNTQPAETKVRRNRKFEQISN